MTTTFHAIILALGLLAIWAWLTISVIKIKLGFVTSESSQRRFSLETGFVRFITYCLFISSMGLIVGCIIRIIRGV